MLRPYFVRASAAFSRFLDDHRSFDDLSLYDNFGNRAAAVVIVIIVQLRLEHFARDRIDLDVVGFTVFAEDVERVLQSAVFLFQLGIHYLAGYSTQRDELCVLDRYLYRSPVRLGNILIVIIVIAITGFCFNLWYRLVLCRHDLRTAKHYNGENGQKERKFPFFRHDCLLLGDSRRDSTTKKASTPNFPGFL